MYDKNNNLLSLNVSPFRGVPRVLSAGLPVGILLVAMLLVILMHSSTLQAGEASSGLISIEDIRDPYYIGLGAGSSFLKPETNSVALSVSQDTDFAYKVFAGYQFDDNWAAEIFWSDLGQAEISSATALAGIVEYQAFGVGGLFQYPVTESWGIFATAGVGRLQNKFQIVQAERVEDSFIYAGGGVMWRFADSWDMRAEYDYYDKDAQILSLNIVKRFGSATSKRIASLENKVQQQEAALANMQAVPVPLVVDKEKSCADYKVELKGVVFEKQSVELTEKSKQILDVVAQKLTKLPKDIAFEIRAHTDDQGSELYNYSLSLMRARNVRDYLATQGIALSEIDAQGYGEWRPVESNKTVNGRNANRRAELVLLGLEKHAGNAGGCAELAAQ